MGMNLGEDEFVGVHDAVLVEVALLFYKPLFDNIEQKLEIVFEWIDLVTRFGTPDMAILNKSVLIPKMEVIQLLREQMEETWREIHGDVYFPGQITNEVIAVLAEHHRPTLFKEYAIAVDFTLIIDNLAEQHKALKRSQRLEDAQTVRASHANPSSLSL